MYINEAVRKAMAIDGYIVRQDWPRMIRLRPTNEVDGIILISPNNNMPRPRWQPRAEDLLADDWIVTTEEVLSTDREC